MIRSLYDFVILVIHLVGLVIMASLALIALTLPKR